MRLALNLGLCLMSSSCTWLDHAATGEIQRELSKKGWAIARIGYADQGRRFDLVYFDGHKAVASFPCCTRAEGERLTRSSIVLVDLTSAPDPSSPAYFRELARSGNGGPVVVMNTEGKILQRSEIEVDSNLLALSPDHEAFAYVGGRLPNPATNWGLHMARFQGKESRLLATTALPIPPDGEWWGASLDWSPDGRALLFSDRDGIRIIDVQTGKTEQLGAGSFARWSPSGDWISFVTPDGQATLMDLRTRETKKIDPRPEVNAPIEWSPDGNYLLVREGEGSYVPYGCYWVYRISDAAWLPLQDLGVAGIRPGWIERFP